jgi:hypothetical protein
MNRTFSDLRRFSTFDERFKYLKLRGQVAHSTFGRDRYINQAFYTSAQWREVRQAVILRDNGCDMGLPGFEIHSGLYIHHMNPMTVEDIDSANPDILDPEFLITVTHATHNAIHYGNESLFPRPNVARKPGDTKLW